MQKMNEVLFGLEAAVFESRAREAAAARLGVWHRHQIAPAMPQAGDAPIVTVEVEVEQAIGQVRCVLAEPEPQVLPLAPANIVWDSLNWRYVQRWEGALPAYPQGTVVRYIVEALPRDGGGLILADNGEIFSYLVGAGSPPAWTAEAIIYQIFVDRFCPGAGRAWNPADDLRDVFGGALRGIIEKLDYLADLGVNCLWLTPIFPDDTAHGYRATDYFSVNPRVGTLDDARELVRAARARGIRLLLDFAANHMSDQHPAFRKAQAERESAEYHWFFWRDWPELYEAYFDVRTMPKINTNHPEARDYLLRSVRFWLEDVGFDGLRLDHANGPTHDFWVATRALVDEIKPEAWLLGEVVTAPPTLRSYAGRLHSVLDLPLAQALRDTFGFGTMSLRAFDAFLAHHERYFPAAFSLPCFLDNHDMDRFLWIAGGDVRRLKLAALCLLTLSNPPILYAGTEMGLSQRQAIHAPDSAGMDECRLPLPWERPPQPDLQGFFRNLLHFRREHPATWRGARRTLYIDDVAQTYAYLRFDAGAEQPRAQPHEAVLVAINQSERPQTIALQGITVELEPVSGSAIVPTAAQRRQMLEE